MDLYILDASPMLVSHTAQPTSAGGKAADGPEVKGAEPHILMVYACCPDLQGKDKYWMKRTWSIWTSRHISIDIRILDQKFREVFLLTYRTFLRPLDVVSLLWKRYQYFEKKTDRLSVIHRRATLDLFVDVIAYLT